MWDGDLVLYLTQYYLRDGNTLLVLTISSEGKIVVWKERQVVMMTTNKQIKQVDFGFENVDSYDLPMKAVKNLSLNGLSTDLHYSGQFKDTDKLGTTDLVHMCRSAEIELDPKPLVKVYADAWVGDDNNQDNLPNLLYRILEYNDITSIGVAYTDGTEQDIIVPWGKYGDSVNTAMICEEGFRGTLIIKIGDDLDRDVFGDDQNREVDQDKLQDQYDHQWKKLYRNLVSYDSKSR